MRFAVRSGRPSAETAVRRRRRELPRIEVETRLVASIGSNGTLDLIDLRGDGPARIGAPSAVAHDGNHAAGRAQSAAVHAGVPEADGFPFVCVEIHW